MYLYVAEIRLALGQFGSKDFLFSYLYPFLLVAPWGESIKYSFCSIVGEPQW